MVDWSKQQHPEKMSISEIINRRKNSIRQEKERVERERLNAQIECLKEQEERVKAQVERARARKEYLKNKYGEKFTLEELEEFERVSQLKIAQEREKEMKRVKKMEDDERQLKRDMYR